MRLNLRNILAGMALLSLAACNANQLDAVKKACDADKVLQPVVASVGTVVSPQNSGIIVMDTTAVHPAVTALCASLTAPADGVDPTTKSQSVLVPAK